MIRRPALALFVGLVVASVASAQTPFDIVTGELRSAEHFLHIANHDYNGHRAAAVKQVKHALHVLHQGHKGTGKSVKHTPNHKIAAKHEGQALSDAQIAKAKEIILVALGQLNTLQQNTQVAAAEKALRNAATDIDKALAYSAKHLRK